MTRTELEARLAQLNDSWFVLLPLSQTDRQWIGLCGAFCLAQNWQLSMESLEAANRSLLWICAVPSAEGSRGVTGAWSKDPSFTSLLKEQVASRRVSRHTHVVTEPSFTNCLPSFQMRRIYSKRKTQRRSRTQ